jgi:hypothetical protein
MGKQRKEENRPICLFARTVDIGFLQLILQLFFLFVYSIPTEDSVRRQSRQSHPLLDGRCSLETSQRKIFDMFTICNLYLES